MEENNYLRIKVIEDKQQFLDRNATAAMKVNLIDMPCLDNESIDRLADLSYKIANAMLKARTKIK